VCVCVCVCVCGFSIMNVCCIGLVLTGAEIVETIFKFVVATTLSV
jgi:hypothetical protein